MEADFSGWATKNDLLCSDGVTIRHGAFKDMDGQRVPLVFQHQHNNPDNVMGYAILHAVDGGVRADGYFNKTPSGLKGKEMVQHGDLAYLSVFANKLRKRGQDVLHGVIREVSLVLAGANPGAVIDNVRLVHADGSYEDFDDEAVITTGETLEHEDKETEGDMTKPGDQTLAELYENMDDNGKKFATAVLAMVFQENQAASVTHGDDDDEVNTEDEEESTEEGEESTEEEETESEETEETEETVQHNDQEGSEMTRNVFETTTEGPKGATLTHDQLSTIIADAKNYNGSFKESLLAHAEDYGITNIEVLFPDARTLETRPEWITRNMEWVQSFLAGTRKVPFSRIKSQSADLTHDEARAKGYVKGTLKKEQFFAVAGRETYPDTVYKKQKLDRDDMIDVTEFDVVAWLWIEMNFMIREEIARAMLIGDGREIDDDDKVEEDKIRPIAHDDEFYTDVVIVPAATQGEALIEAILRARKRYKGSGPNAYAQEDVITDLLLLKDKLGRRLYPTMAELATALRVREIISVEVMEGAMTDDGDLLMVIVNPGDYSVGTDKGGELTKFDDFDIDYNQYKYLLETRLSGALTKPKRAQVVVREAGTSATPTMPGFVSGTGVVTIPTITGITYYQVVIDGENVELDPGAQDALAAGESISIEAVPDEGYYFPHNTDDDWTFTRPSA